METFYTTDQAIDLSTPLYCQLVHALTNLLPPPLDDTQASLRTRDLAAIAKVAALLPVNANEADLAAQCIAARAQAEDLLRLLRQHADDIQLVMRLNAQYASMVRTSLSVHARLMRVQAVRHKREANEGAANQDTWVQHVAERSMLSVVDPDAVAQQSAPPAWPGEAPATWPRGVHPDWLRATPVETPAASPQGAPAVSPQGAPAVSPEGVPPVSPEAVPPAWSGATPVETPSASGNQRTAENVSKNGTNSQAAASETRMSAIHWNGPSNGLGKISPRDIAREIMARSRLAGREPPANARQTLGSAD
jgi:hypothetical protein